MKKIFGALMVVASLSSFAECESGKAYSGEELETFTNQVFDVYEARKKEIMAIAELTDVDGRYKISSADKEALFGSNEELENGVVDQGLYGQLVTAQMYMSCQTNKYLLKMLDEKMIEIQDGVDYRDALRAKIEAENTPISQEKEEEIDNAAQEALSEVQEESKKERKRKKRRKR